MLEIAKLLVELKDSTLALLVLVALSPTAALLFVYLQEKKTNKILQACLSSSLVETAKTLSEIVTLLDVLVYGREKKR